MSEQGQLLRSFGRSLGRQVNEFSECATLLECAALLLERALARYRRRFGSKELFAI